MLYHFYELQLLWLQGYCLKYNHYTYDSYENGITQSLILIQVFSFCVFFPKQTPYNQYNNKKLRIVDINLCIAIY